MALGVNIERKKEALGLWIAEKEGAKFWASVLKEIRNRGTQDILIACMDGLTGFPEAVRARSGYNAMYCAHGPQFGEVRIVHGLESGLGRSESDLPCSKRRGREGGSGTVR
jgi:hypothetical protein